MLSGRTSGQGRLSRDLDLQAGDNPSQAEIPRHESSWSGSIEGREFTMTCYNLLYPPRWRLFILNVVYSGKKTKKSAMSG